MTQYAVLIYGDESAFTDMSPEAWSAMMDAHRAFAVAVGEQGGTIVGGEALAPSATATSVHTHAGQTAQAAPAVVLTSTRRPTTPLFRHCMSTDREASSAERRVRRR